VNVRHIIPLPHKIDIAKDSTDEEVLKALEAKGLAEYVKRKAEVSRW
jgi:ribosomal protein L14E/L6E/L27E